MQPLKDRLIKGKNFVLTIGVTVSLFSGSCTEIIHDGNNDTLVTKQDTIRDFNSLPGSVSDNSLPPPEIIIHDTLPSISINTANVSAESLVSFAETLIGTRYKYASTDPAEGFDCSGFITYVFNHFNIKVPRSSIDFTNVGSGVSLQDAMRGDIVLFTGTDSTERFVGHMGIVTKNDNGDLQFIHSSSGKADGVTLTPLNNYYRGRFVKVIRIFLQT
jgi:cell wall-associated NlpC family hydrolase